MMPAPRVLVVCKKSSRPDRARGLSLRARESHNRALRAVLAALRGAGLRVKTAYRVRSLDTRRYGLIVSVGGDGTFLEAARGAGARPVLGVNSDPERSAGSFCAADARSFPAKLRALLRGRAKTLLLRRMAMRLNGRPLGYPVLNEVLVTHRRPAAMSRYWLRVGRAREEQRGSGLWVATAAGSTGAIRSAGARPLPRASRALVYRPRELYRGGIWRPRLRGGALPAGRGITVGSLMQEGMLCADGEHLTHPFLYGDVLELRSTAPPLRLVL